MKVVISNDNKITELWKKDANFINSLSSEDLFRLIMISHNNETRISLIERDFNLIIDRCSIDYDMYNFFTILALKFIGGGYYKETCDQIIDNTVRKIFSKETIIYLLKRFKKIKGSRIPSKQNLFEEIIEELKKMDTSKSSIILFDLFIFPDFRLMLFSKYRVIATLIDAYQIYDPNVVSSQIFNGSTIIGKLLQGENETIAARHIRDILKEQQISTRNIKMIGGGGSSLVYRIRDVVIKFGETRNNRKIYINHRILASLVRKLELSPDGEELFYLEVMKYAQVGDVTPEERDELKKDLYEQGLIWDDDKLENCGLLPEGYENICDLPVDYIEVAGRIDNPYSREEFMSRPRKVVVIDNDNIRLNPLKLRR